MSINFDYQDPEYGFRLLLGYCLFSVESCRPLQFTNTDIRDLPSKGGTRHYCDFLRSYLRNFGVCLRNVGNCDENSGFHLEFYSKDLMSARALLDVRP
jgi:hypothetical protein